MAKSHSQELVFGVFTPDELKNTVNTLLRNNADNNNKEIKIAEMKNDTDLKSCEKKTDHDLKIIQEQAKVAGRTFWHDIFRIVIVLGILAAR